MFRWGAVLCAVAALSGGFNVSSPDTRLAVCVKKILSRITKYNTFTSDVFLTNSKSTVTQSLHGIERTRFITRAHPWVDHYVYGTIHVMHFNSYVDMKNTFDVIVDDTFWIPRSNFIISMDHFQDYLTNITEFLVLKNMYNVTFLSKEVGEYTIYSFPSPIWLCRRPPRLVNITRCSDYDRGPHIFPTMNIKCFRGCHFKLAANNIYPMVNMDGDGFDGFEQQMLKLFSKRYHFDIELIEMHKIDKYERVVGNFTYTGMLGMVRAGRVEGAVGGYFLDGAVIGKFFFTYPVLTDYMVLIMPRANVYNAWLALYYKAFDASVAVLCLVVVFSVLAHVLALFPTRERDPVRDFIVVFGLFLNKTSIRKMKNGIPETLLLSSLLYSVFILPYVMQAFLSSVKTHPIRDFEVKLASEINENYKLILPEKWKRTYLDITNKSETCGNRLGCLNQVARCKDRKHYTIMSDLIYMMFKWMPEHGRCGTDTYHLREPLNCVLRTTYFRSGSVLGEHFDKFIFKYVASGLLNKHVDDIFLRERLRCRDVVEPTYEVLDLVQVRPAFVILVGGSTLSFICFAFEILANKLF